MPAGRYLILKFIIFSAALGLLTSCSRENPLNVPEPYVEPEEPYCIENGPYAYYTLIESVSVSNMVDSLPQTYPYGFEGKTVSLTAPYLIEDSEIRPLLINEVIGEQDPVSGEIEDYLRINQKVVISELSDHISPQQYAEIESWIPKAKNLSVSINYPVDTGTDQAQIDEENLFVTSELAYGENQVSINVSAGVKVPRTFVDCLNPLTQEEIDSEDFKVEDDGYKLVTYTQKFSIEIHRNELDKFKASQPEHEIILSENDRLGKVVAVNDQFLILGSSEEDTSAQGIFSVTQGFSQNEDSPDSGVVYIFKKNELNSWNLHTVIKSSNSEAGDLFGSAVSLYENTLVVSAVGESSIASGVNLSAHPETDNLKLNNSAANSGALYIYQYDEENDLWAEVYYIKPDRNVVSNSKYDKGFGTQLSLFKNRLMVSAPLENSSNGEFSNSERPESGAVYIYNRSSDVWSYSGVLKAFNPGAGDKFGSSISLNDKFYAVGAPFEDHGNRLVTNKIEDIVFPEGSPFESNTRPDSGSVYIYEQSLNNNIFKLTTHIKSSNSDINDYFGTSLAILDDSLFVGSIGEDSSGKGVNRDMDKNDLPDSGAVYNFVYNAENQVWTENAYIKANDSQRDASFGKFMVADNSNLFISAPLFDSSTVIDAGKSYYYKVSGSNIVQELLFGVRGDTSNMRVGSTMALWGRNFILGASGTVQQSGGFDEPFAGAVFTFQ